MIFFNNDGNLSFRKEINFKLEKDLQTLVEKNMKTIFGLKFVTTEFPIESYRFDSVAFDEETKSFVIIEYKRGRNESLVDQGYAYLYTLLDRKADFVLLYNDIFNTSKGIKDFDWTQTRIMFVSPKFTDYQKNATAFSNMPFELYEIKQYENGIILVDEVNRDKSVKADSPESVKDEKINKVTKEVIIYKEEDSLSKGDEYAKELYYELKSRILNLGNVKIAPKKLYIAFKGKTNVCDIVTMKNQLKVFINLKEGQLKDPFKMARLIKNVGHWGNGDYEMIVKDEETLNYTMSLIKQSYEINT
ncbi:MAG: hypothetical protein IJA70_10500 [Oscillospiraceae bacterium]|nr:hypothetical protein [Oscillospiraceae bacterium]MBQ4642756.1 hypothetical protein [Oscillospiraceae bacterium]